MKRFIILGVATTGLAATVYAPKPWSVYVALAWAIYWTVSGALAYRSMRECERRIAEIDAQMDAIKQRMKPPEVR